MRLFLVGFVWLVAACTPGAPPAEAPVENAVAAQAAPITGHYIAISNTAMSITGDMDISAEALSFAKGFRLEGGAIESALAGDTDLTAGGGTANDGSGLNLTDIELRGVTLRTAADAPLPILCGDLAVNYVLIGRDGETVSVQMYGGGGPPGPNAHDTQLCGIFNFAAE